MYFEVPGLLLLLAVPPLVLLRWWMYRSAGVSRRVAGAGMRAENGVHVRKEHVSAGRPLRREPGRHGQARPLSSTFSDETTGLHKSPLLILPLDIWNGSRGPDAPAGWKALRVFSGICMVLAWYALALAAAGPMVRTIEGKVPKTGTTVVFVVDVSPSMAARDLDPDRLGAAADIIRLFAGSPEGAGGAAVGVTAFGSEAAMVCPPTTDYYALVTSLEMLKPGWLGEGTAVGQGLASAGRQLEEAARGASLVVLLSDGEDNIGGIHPIDAARALADGGSGFAVVSIGVSGDIPVTYTDPLTGRRTEGVYRSVVDARAMTSLAAAARGGYREIRSAEDVALSASWLGTLTASSAAAPRFASSAVAGYHPKAADRRDADGMPVGRTFVVLALILVALAFVTGRLVFGGVV